MHPRLFNIPLPEFLARLLGVHALTVYTYAFCIVLGAVLACLYIKRKTKIEFKHLVLPNSFFYKTFVAGFIGGKLFCYLERPVYYFDHPRLLLNIFSGGFVCYGSIICIILFAVHYCRKHAIPAFGFLDIIAIAGLIPMAIGRSGCFFAGCCYGKPTDSIFGVVFPDTAPIAVHPTQLYEALMLTAILIILLVANRYKNMQGQVFLLNISLYGIGRFFLEFIRGDFRGSLFNGFISHAQATAVAAIMIALFLLTKLKQQYKTI
jgi:phosphatidylglycerol:prolipoprotein diacylglycerol transferase